VSSAVAGSRTAPAALSGTYPPRRTARSSHRRHSTSIPRDDATPNGELSPLQARIDLALPPNRGLPGATFRLGDAGLREAGYEIPEVTQVGRSYNMPGGGYEMQFPYPIPPEFIKAMP
jgi:hypothetical protein